VVFSAPARDRAGGDRRVVSGIVFVIKNGLRSRNALGEYGPHMSIDKRFASWSRSRLRRDIRGTGAQGREAGADHDRRQAPAAGPLKRGLFPDGSDAREAT